MPISPEVPDVRRRWRTAQAVAFGVGLAVFAALVFWPEAGLTVLWSFLIPVAPALVAFVPGVWRNLCPLAWVALLPARLGIGWDRPSSPRQRAWFARIGVVLLLAIIPLRHVVLDLNGPATAALLAGAVFAAVGMGLLFRQKSGWCSGVCPIHPVERLYGVAPAVAVANAHCGACRTCVAPCPDSVAESDALTANGDPWHKLTGLLMAGAFPGYVWGWFHVPHYAGGEGWRHLDQAYGLPLLGGASTLAAFLLLRAWMPAGRLPLLFRAFAASAIGCYYWYRVPSLFGLGLFPGDGVLVDLHTVLPVWFVEVSRGATTLLCAWWFLARGHIRRPWTVRPPVMPCLATAAPLQV